MAISRALTLPDLNSSTGRRLILRLEFHHHKMAAERHFAQKWSRPSSWHSALRPPSCRHEQLKGVVGRHGELRTEHSSFVLEPAYSELIRTLDARTTILTGLQSSPPPVTPTEVDALRTVATEYTRLRDNLSQAIDALVDT
jgi:hypothetical protein